MNTKWGAGIVAGVLLLGACSSGPGEISQGDLENEVATQLAAKTNQPKPDISCPSGLEGKVGAELDCTLSVAGDNKEYNVHVKVTSVDKDSKQANFDIEVANQPNQ